MAAYQPEPTLFRAQLQSIQRQTVTDFVCVISADSDPAAIATMAYEFTQGDPRFTVCGGERRRGFYLNFENALAHVPAEVEWVALADQDDRWHEEKLATLIRHLDGASLVSGQARVVRYPGGEVVTATTRRREVSFDDLLVHNQITGAQSLFRRSLLDVALPFPRVHAVTAVHDHWLALCASVDLGYVVVDEVLQDYVQHGANLIGEVEGQPVDLRAAASRIRQLAVEYEGGVTSRDLATVCNRLSFGWRRAALVALRDRHGAVPPVARAAWEAFSPGHRAVPMARFLWERVRSHDVANGTVATFLPGLPLEVFRRTRLEG
jgi:hypothetical protein